ncbi:MAG: peptidoglycan DD-metalloendopeptidase family protein [Angelakisella sp.]
MRQRAEQQTTQAAPDWQERPAAQDEIERNEVDEKPKGTAKLEPLSKPTGFLAGKFAALKATRDAARRSSEEQAEDEAKFGGLNDDSTTEHELTAAEQVLYSLKQVVAAQKKSIVALSQRVVTPIAKKETPGELGQLFRWCNTECYYIGVQLIRYQSDIRRLLFRMSIWIKYTIPPFFSQKRVQLVRFWDKIADSCLSPFREISSKTKALRYDYDHREATPQKGGVAGMVARYLYSLGRPLNRVMSFLLPILGCAVLTAVILYFQQLNYALEVEYAGRNLGYVQSESDFYDARERMLERLKGEDYLPADDSRPTFRLVIVDPEDYTSVDSLANNLLAMSQNKVTTADGIYVDNTFLGAVEDGNEFLLYIDGILQEYRTGIEHEKVQFVKKVAVQKGVYPVSAMRPVNAIKTDLESNNTVPQLHLVAKGETLESVAEQYNTTSKAIISLNSQLETRAEDYGIAIPPLSPGEEIMVNRVELSLGIQVTRRETYTEELPFGTDYKDDNRYPENYSETIANGKTGEQEIVADVVYIDGERAGETRIDVTVTREPVNARKMRGTLKPAQFLPAGSDTSANFMWPVAGGYVSCGLYGYRGHTGMDIAANGGTGIYASRSGTITAAYNYVNGPYGKHLSINHGNNVTTLYAHCSQVLVQAGQYVRQGQLIAKVGRTGNATGNHCHFEIRINGRVMNPADFVGNRYPG